MTSSDEWALEIYLERFKADLVELLKQYSADEVAELLELRCTHLDRRQPGAETK